MSKSPAIITSHSRTICATLGPAHCTAIGTADYYTVIEPSNRSAVEAAFATTNRAALTTSIASTHQAAITPANGAALSSSFSPTHRTAFEAPFFAAQCPALEAAIVSASNASQQAALAPAHVQPDQPHGAADQTAQPAAIDDPHGHTHHHDANQGGAADLAEAHGNL